jgi:hypothetical protein
MRVCRVEQSLFGVRILETLVARYFAFQANRCLAADLERRPGHVALPDGPVEHLSQEPQVVVDGAR